METTLGISIATSVIISELFGVSPGGIVVPGYMWAYTRSPERVVATIGVAIATLILYRLGSRYFLLFGRRRFAAMIMIGLFLRMALQKIISLGTVAGPEWTAVGYIVPGLIAMSFERHGIWRPLAAMVIAITFLELVAGAF